MRRLGLVAGFVGAIACAFVSYTHLKPLLAQRSQNKRFDSLVLSHGVQKEIEFLKTNGNIGAIVEINADELTPVPVVSEAKRVASGVDGKTPKKSIEEIVNESCGGECVKCGESGGSAPIKEGGIKRVFFGAYTTVGGEHCFSSKTSANDITAIQTDDGQTILRTDPPATTSYIALLVFPLVGFLVPWGILKALTWIATGFFPAKAGT